MLGSKGDVARGTTDWTNFVAMDPIGEVIGLNNLLRTQNYGKLGLVLQTGNMTQHFLCKNSIDDSFNGFQWHKLEFQGVSGRTFFLWHKSKLEGEHT